VGEIYVYLEELQDMNQQLMCQECEDKYEL
jgi:hypothetical protein